MNKNFEEQEKKAKGGVRLAREEVFKIIFGVEATESTSDELIVKSAQVSAYFSKANLGEKVTID